jgi:septal ring factor EnvC (AmiA/AmiB activator)
MWRRHPGLILSPLIALLVLAAMTGRAQESSQARLESVKREILRLREDLDRLSRQRSGILLELARLEAQARLRDAELTRLELELEGTRLRLESERSRLETLDAQLGRREEALALRLRGLYRQGPLGHHRLLLAVERPGEVLDAARLVRQATVRDGRALAAFRRVREERARAERSLEERRRSLEAGESEAGAARRALAEALAGRRRMLRRIDRDREVREEALAELLEAEKDLSSLLAGLSPPGAAAPSLDMAKFRGLLDWPVEGRVTVPFGDQEHPRFRTAVPHPGLDLEAPHGRDVKAVFDGRVVFAEWFRGYGLTLILDHGGGYLSVYAHASVLLVEKGAEVVRGEVVAKVGDTGSLKGPYLYFEIRKDGKPEDPRSWLGPAR